MAMCLSPVTTGTASLGTRAVTECPNGFMPHTVHPSWRWSVEGGPEELDAPPTRLTEVLKGEEKRGKQKFFVFGFISLLVSLVGPW